MNTIKLLGFVMLAAMVGFGATGCKKKFMIQDVDPTRAGQVRSLGPESQDARAVSDEMLRSMLASPVLNRHEEAPIIHMLPMVNNTRHNFNQEVFTSLLKANLNQDSNGRLFFRSGDTWDDMEREREMKRAGQVDYNPELRARVPVGADYFLRGRADGLATVSRVGQSDYIVYTFKLVDAETGIEVWEGLYETNKEGRDDLIYR